MMLVHENGNAAAFFVSGDINLYLDVFRHFLLVLTFCDCPVPMRDQITREVTQTSNNRPAKFVSVELVWEKRQSVPC